MSNEAERRGLVSPDTWYASMASPTVIGRMVGASLRCFNGTDPTLTQPALDENIIAIHLGDRKRVERWQEGTHRSWDIPLHAITLMPAYCANRWHTDGVIAYAHLTFGTAFLKRLARDEFGRDPSDLVLLDKVGLNDPLLAELMLALGKEFSIPGMRRLYRDSLLTTLGITVLQRHSTLFAGSRAPAPGRYTFSGGLSGWQLKKVTEHLTLNALRDVSVDELVQITGLSRAQFFRAFHRSTGFTPARYIQHLRMRHAASLLEGGRSISEVAKMIGYDNSSYFAAVFRSYNGSNPSDWRRIRKSANHWLSWPAAPE